ncbi:hypothetical protein LG274_02695 [Micrococcus antarcticus]|uniref:hypothetical protein n=1 Tax=Micrococcus antarcticus TaxID=86171 RepID=UPI00384E37D0
MPELTIAELRARSKGRPESLVVTVEDGTRVTLTHLLLLPTERKDQYLDALEKFMKVATVDGTASRAERRAADKAAGRKVGTTKAAEAAEDAPEFTSEDVADTIAAMRQGLLDAERVGETAGDVITAAILDEKVAKRALTQLDAIDRAELIALHLGADQQGEASASA